MQAIGVFSKFEQCVLNMALINICDRESYVGQEMRQQYNAWKQTTQEAVCDPWQDLHQFTIYLPHRDQDYEGITLSEGLSRGYNIEVEPVQDRSNLPYNIPPGGHFVIVLRQKQIDGEFAIAATGVFVRPLGLLSLDVILDPDLGEYQSLMVQHPIIRQYPEDWQTQMTRFLQGEIPYQELSPVVRSVDRFFNPDYRTPDWQDVYLAASEFAVF